MFTNRRVGAYHALSLVEPSDRQARRARGSSSSAHRHAGVFMLRRPFSIHGSGAAGRASARSRSCSRSLGPGTSRSPRSAPTTTSTWSARSGRPWTPRGARAVPAGRRRVRHRPAVPAGRGAARAPLPGRHGPRRCDGCPPVQADRGQAARPVPGAHDRRRQRRLAGWSPTCSAARAGPGPGRGRRRHRVRVRADADARGGEPDRRCSPGALPGRGGGAHGVRDRGSASPAWCPPSAARCRAPPMARTDGPGLRRRRRRLGRAGPRPSRRRVRAARSWSRGPGVDLRVD